MKAIIAIIVISLVVLAGCSVFESNYEKYDWPAGTFEAKINDQLVFDNTDVVDTCLSADCSGITYCTALDESYSCEFNFVITLSEEAGQREADATNSLEVIEDETGEGYLNATMDYFVKGESFDSLHITADLKGKPVEKQIVGVHGIGATKEEAIQNTMENARDIQGIFTSTRKKL